MDPVFVTALLFGSMFLCLAIGAPIAIALGGLTVGMIYGFWSPNALSMLPIKAFSSASSFEYLGIPLFIFMAAMLQRSQIADDLYEAMYRFFSGVRGGLAIGTVAICTIFAAMAGISGAATISMGLLALPAMLARNYHKGIALGCIAAGGSLGILIPPSVTMINLRVGRRHLDRQALCWRYSPGPAHRCSFCHLHLCTRPASAGNGGWLSG